MVDEEFFLYKIYALFHDPPHKMTVLMGKKGYDYFRENSICKKEKERECSACEKENDNTRAHEKEAECMRCYLGIDRLINLINKVKVQEKELDNKNIEEKVRAADILASEYNRWVLNYLYSPSQRKSSPKYFKSRYTFKYFKFHNIFNPEYSVDADYDIDYDKMDRFMEKFHKIIDKFIEKQITGNTLDKTKIFKLIKSVYFLIYTIYEPLWIYFDLPVEVEDSRSPFYTIFDHLYASASMINWVYYDDRSNPKGFYVVIDIPGVQEIINSARKASDYWAGSWMLSMIIWLTVWQIIKEYGPDVLLAPTTRFNPIYYAMTLNYLEKEFGMDDGLKKEIEEILNIILGELSGIYDYTQFLKEAIIPATASLILPKEQNTYSIKLEQKIFEYYKNAYNCIVKEIPTGNVQSEVCKEFVEAFNIVYQSNSTLDNLMNVIINEAEKYADKILIRPAIYIVDIDDIRGEVESDLRNKNVSAILNNEQFNKLVPQYIFHYISTKLFREKVKEKYKREILPKPNWFTSFNKEFDYINGGKDWEYCTVCGNEPAIINFGKENDDYSASTKCEILRLAYQNGYKVTDDDLKDLKVWFKPGEKLGPLCIIKRGLYFRLRKNLEKAFKSTDDIAYSYYKDVIQPRIKDLDECEKLKNFLNAEELDVYEAFGNPVIARRLFSKCTEIEDKKLPCIQKEYGVSDVNNAFINAIKSYREFYAIIKADADDMTKLARGEIDAEKYFEVLPQLIKGGEFEYDEKRKESKNLKNKACEDLISTYSIMTSLAKVINNGNILMSPTYRVALSLAMMITLLRDIKTVEVENYGQIIYAGGDDVVALVPVDRLIDTLIGLERNFIGENGFFRVRQWYIPTFYPHGRSFSVRIVNIADFMTNEIRIATELLNKVKKVIWASPNGKENRSKFSVILSTSRTSYESVLPMWDFKYLILLKKMWLLNLSNKLSSSVFEDYENAFKEFITSERELTRRLINYVLLKNNGKELVEDFNELDFLSLNNESNVYNEIFKAFRIMRGVI